MKMFPLCGRRTEAQSALPTRSSLPSVLGPLPPQLGPQEMLGACPNGERWVPHPSQNVQNEVLLNPSCATPHLASQLGPASVVSPSPSTWSFPLSQKPSVYPNSKINTRRKFTKHISTLLEDA